MIANNKDELVSLISELKRRNVFRVGTAYAVVAWVVMQVVDIVLPTFDAPRWVNQTLLFLIILGFPFALVLAWAFELTPDGIKPTTEVPAEQSVRAQTGQKMNYLVVGGLAVLLLLVVLDSYVLEDTVESNPAVAEQDASETQAIAPAVTVVEKTIAVLPFVNLSSDAEQEYFSDGLSEEILNRLAQVGELRVTARTSSFSFKGLNEDVRVIGEKLGVRHVLEGSVRKVGKDLRITAQLIDAADGTEVWSRQYDRELNDVFAIQDEIAMAVSETLSVTLDVGVMSRANGGTTNLEAYDNYLRARVFDRRRGTREDLLQAADYYRNAVMLDPTFIRAWSYLHQELAAWLIYVPDRASEARSEMETITARLTELAPASAYTASIQATQLMDQHRWSEAAKAIAATIAAGGDFRTDVTSADSVLLLNTGRIREAIPNLEKRRLTDPLSLNASYGWQIMMHLAGRDAEAQVEYERGKSLEGDHALIDQFAVMRMSKLPEIYGSTPEQLYQSVETARTLRLGGTLGSQQRDRAESLATLHAALDDPENQTASAMLSLANLADAYDDGQLALAALHRSYVDLRGTNIGILWQPFKNVSRNDPQFKNILRELGLVDYFRTSGNWGDYCRPVNDDFECF
jgi:TolB-like protein